MTLIVRPPLPQLGLNQPRNRILEPGLLLLLVRPRRDELTVDEVPILEVRGHDVDQRPWTVTDRCDRFEGFHEITGYLDVPWILGLQSITKLDPGPESVSRFSG